MSNPVTIQNHVYSGFTSGTEVVSTSFAYGIPAWVTVRIYEASDPDTNLTFNELSAGTFEVSYEPGMPANGTLVVVLDVPYAELVREVKDGQVFKEDTLENLLQQSIMATATILEGRFPSVSEPFNMSGFKITDMADPTNAQDAVTKAYGDANYGVTAAADAETAKDAAETAKAAAETARDSAYDWAQEAEDAVVSDGVNPNGFSSFHYSQKAEAAKTDAVAAKDAAEAIESSLGSVADLGTGTALTNLGYNASGDVAEISLGDGLIRDSSTLAIDKHSQAEAEAGTSNTKVMTALRTKQAIDANIPSAVFAQNYTSSQVYIGTSMTFAHGLGAVPKLIQIYGVCTSSEYGYFTGDKVLFNNGIATVGTSAIGFGVSKDATNISVRTGDVGAQYVINGLDGTREFISRGDANWELVVEAWA